jgi:ABC-type transport system substrate-binding protein
LEVQESIGRVAAVGFMWPVIVRTGLSSTRQITAKVDRRLHRWQKTAAARIDQRQRFALPLGARAQSVQALNIAVIGEPGPLEPTNTTSSLISEIDQHIYEGLYAFNPALESVPVLAAALPQTTPDGKSYRIPLRENVPFHDGTLMTAEDVVVCLRRWLAVSPRGRPGAPYVDGISAPDAKSVQITMNQPYSPLLSLLAYFNGPAVVMPKRLAQSNDRHRQLGRPDPAVAASMA